MSKSNQPVDKSTRPISLASFGGRNQAVSFSRSLKASGDDCRTAPGLVAPLYGDDEHAGPALREEAFRVEHDRIQVVAQGRQRPDDDGEVLATVRREEAEDVFKQHQRRPTVSEGLQDPGERKEGRGGIAVEAAAVARETEVLTGEPRRGEERVARNAGDNLLYVPDIFKVEMFLQAEV